MLHLDDEVRIVGLGGQQIAPRAPILHRSPERAGERDRRQRVVDAPLHRRGGGGVGIERQPLGRLYAADLGRLEHRAGERQRRGCEQRPEARRNLDRRSRAAA